MNNQLRSDRIVMLDAVAEAVNEAIGFHVEDAKSNPLYGDAVYYLIQEQRLDDLPYVFSERHSPAVKDAVEALRAKPGVKDEDIISILAKTVSIDVSGVYIPNNAVNGWNLGEQEIQLEDLRSLDLAEDEVTYLKRKIDAYWDGKSDLVYVSMDYDVVWATIDDIEKLRREIRRFCKARMLGKPDFTYEGMN